MGLWNNFLVSDTEESSCSEKFEWEIHCTSLSLRFCYSLDPCFPFHAANWGLFIAVISLSLRLSTYVRHDVTFSNARSWSTLCSSYLLRKKDSSNSFSLLVDDKMLLDDYTSLGLDNDGRLRGNVDAWFAFNNRSCKILNWARFVLVCEFEAPLRTSRDWWLVFIAIIINFYFSVGIDIIWPKVSRIWWDISSET